MFAGGRLFGGPRRWSPASAPESSVAEIFTDRAREAGIDFAHFNGMSGKRYYVETVGSGAALFDYDNDGDLDIFIVQGNVLGPGKTLADAMFPPKGPLPLKGRLFRNDTVLKPDGTRVLKFTDVTEESGINACGYGMGVTAGDFNNDGWVDLYVTNFGHNQLWRNNGDGTFTDVTQASGTDVLGWSVSAAFVDYDHDGWLDLFVGNYVNFDFTNLKTCFASSGAVDYCGPLSYDPLPNHLFRNRRDGTFEDVSLRSRIGLESAGALGIACADFNGDGLIDLYIADDERPNLLWMNQGDETFKNQAMIAGCAVNKDGIPQSSMGVDAGDFDNDGHEDLIVSNLTGEYATLYVNDGNGWFDDKSHETGLTVPTSPYTGFGAGFIDYDNDGWLDILIVNGAVKTIEALARSGDCYPLGQPKLLLRNLGNGKFADVSSRAGKAFELLQVGRGAAFGDLDNDGDTDVLVVNNNGPAQLLINNEGHHKHWLGVRMVGEKVNRDILGTRVALFRPHGPTLWRRARAEGSFGSSNDPRVLFGLGDSPEVTKVRAYWVSGRIEEWTGLRINQYTTLREGSGKPATK
jgi:hypothetical protein